MLQSSAMERCATFDPTGRYRYRLGRRWSGGANLAIVMLNPSQADGRADDPTIRRCIGLAAGWGFGAITVVNLFAYCSPQPQVLKQVADPVGPDNDATLLTAARQTGQILLAWGNGGRLQGRDRAVLTLLAAYRDQFCCLGHNRTGQPRHPLYLPLHAAPIPWAEGVGLNADPID